MINLIISFFTSIFFTLYIFKKFFNLQLFNMSTPSVNAIAIKLPPFWKEYPHAWFLTVESQFNTRNISVEKTKYDYVLQSLPVEIVTSVFDLISSSGNSDAPYTDLKNALISRNSVSESKRVEQLLSSEELGDKTPSQFYIRMKSLSSQSQSQLINDDLLKELWLRRLPSLISALVKSSGKTDIKDVLQVADSVHETMHQQNFNTNFGVNAIASSSTSDIAMLELKLQNQRLESEISEIKQMLSNKNNYSNNYDRNRSPGRYNSNFRSFRNRSKSPRRNEGNGLCFYHQKFGRKAHKCVPPCNWNHPN